MTNFQSRLLLTLTVLPTVFASLFWPMKTHIIVILVFGIAVTVFGSYEFNSLIYKKGIDVRRWFIPTVNTFIYLFAYAVSINLFGINNSRICWECFVTILLGTFMFIYARDIFKSDLTDSLEKMAYTIMGILYIGVPSFFLPFLFNVSSTPLPPEECTPIFANVAAHGTLTGSLLAVFFIVLVWGNDIFAYVFGMAFGRSNVIGLTVSPKKSWAGYIGGYLSVFFFTALFYIMFDTDLLAFIPFCGDFIGFDWWFYFVFPAITGFLVPAGDLAESVIKRSANVKDSGNVILGRGGLLDSVDTLLYLMPSYFMLIQLYMIVRR